jgi:hypothetical protein
MRKGSPSDIARKQRLAVEMREMIREAAAGMEAAGMAHVVHIPHEHVERRRIWAGVPDRRSLTGRLLGDPIPERSALRYMEAAE